MLHSYFQVFFVVVKLTETCIIVLTNDPLLGNNTEFVVICSLKRSFLVFKQRFYNNDENIKFSAVTQHLGSHKNMLVFKSLTFENIFLINS